MSTPYTVVSGDTLSGIAQRFGYASWQEIYNHADNAGFRRQRPDPDLIFPGDVIMLPDRPGSEPPPVPEATTVTAVEGDTLCTLAIAAGFRDCLPLRALPENAAFLNRPLQPGDVVTIPALSVAIRPRGTDSRHSFRRRGRRVGIRFVHGSRNLPYRDDLTLNELNVSNYVTTRAGVEGSATAMAAANQSRFDADTDVDEDSFKVEVTETRPSGRDLEVLLEARKPTYDAAGNFLDGRHTDFPGDPRNNVTERGRRALVTSARLLTTGLYRTAYLRLVVDNIDKAARNDQALLVQEDPADRRVQILDQNVRATYVVHDCPAPAAARCRVVAETPVARGLTCELAIHVVRDAPVGAVERAEGGPNDNGVVRLREIRERVESFCRRHWAQAHVKFRIVELRTVDRPSDMLSVGDATGAVARGTEPTGARPGRVGFTVRVRRFGRAPDTVHVVAPININAGDTPERTANRLQAQIAVLPDLAARVSLNPPEAGDVNGSADILITDAHQGRITITNLSDQAVDQDADQKTIVASAPLNPLIRNDFHDYHVGHPEERNFFKSLDTGDSRIDVVVIRSFSGRPTLLGFTIPENKQLNANRREMPSMMNSILMRQDSSDGTGNQPYALPHEIGHALTDNSLHADAGEQLMFPTLINPTDVLDPKRLTGHDPAAANWDMDFQNADGTVGQTRFRMNAARHVRDVSAAPAGQLLR